MKGLLTFALLLCASAASAATYYVDCGAAAGGNGSLATPWDAVSDVNGASFSAGDSVLFKKGCTFRETLTVPSSGSAGSPITFGAYGSGAQPILNGSTLATDFYAGVSGNLLSDLAAEKVGGTGWSAPAGDVTVTTNYAADPNGLMRASRITEAGAGGNVQHVVTVSASTQYTFSFYAKNNGGTKAAYSIYDHSNGANIVASTSYFASINGTTWTRLSYTFTTPVGCVSIGIYPMRDAGATADVLVWGVVLNAGAAAAAYTYDNVWAAAVTNGSERVFLDNTEGAEQVSAVACDSQGDWFWAANVLTLYDTSNPNLRSSPGVEVIRPGANPGVLINSKNYITLDGLEITKSYENGILVQPESGGTVNGLTISSCSVTYASSHGLLIQDYGDTLIGTASGSVNTITISDSTFGHNGYMGTMVAAKSVGAGGITFLRCLAEYNGMLGPAHGFSSGTNDAGDDAENITYRSCEARYNYDLGVTGEGSGFVFDDNASNSVIENSYSHDNEGSGFVVAHSSSGNRLSYSIASNNGRSGILVLAGTDVSVFNNTLYNNTINLGFAGRGAIQLYGANTRVAVRNNIAYGSAAGYGIEDFDGGATALSCSNNATYNNTDGATNGITCTAGITSDPLFLSASDFHLQPGSPAINAGVGVGLTSDYVGTALPIGAAPDIGAYENLDYGSYTHIDGEINLNPPVSAVRRVGGN